MATIKDVAERAGVAKETVSRVLNNRGYISEETRDKVYRAMEELHYTPNAFAQGLSKKNMDSIAVVVPHINHPFFAAMISGIEHEARERGYKMFLYHSNGEPEQEGRILQLCQSSFISGVLLFSAEISAEIMARYNIPIILIEREAVSGAYSIQSDNKLGGKLAADYLLQSGRRDLLVIGARNHGHMPGDIRAAEFVRICGEAGVECHTYLSTPGQYQDMEHQELIEQALNEHPGADGIFATSDVIGAQVLQVCHDRRIKVPKQIRIVGFDDVSTARLTYPRLTTIHQPIREMARKAMEAVDAIQAGGTFSPLTILPVTLVKRET